MGMVCYLRSVSPRLFRKLRDNPSLMDAIVSTPFVPMPQVDRSTLDKMPAQAAEAVRRSTDFVLQARRKKLNELEKRFPGEFERIVEEMEQPPLSLRKEWHAIHYMLIGGPVTNGSALSQAILGGTEMGGDLGYGPARYLEPEKVAEVSMELSQLSKREFLERFDPESMQDANIYPGVWEDDYEEYASELFDRLSGYYREAADRGRAMLLYIV